MTTNPNNAAEPATPSAGPALDGSWKSSTESAISPSALPTEAELRATDLEDESVAPVEDSDDTDRESRIRHAAYIAYLRREGQPGDPAQDWLDAEREVDGRGNG